MELPPFFPHLWTSSKCWGFQNCCDFPGWGDSWSFMDSVRLELTKRCIIHSFPRHPARCWQLHLALSHTFYATICWPIQERCSCADFCLQHCNKEQFFKDVEEHSGAASERFLPISHQSPFSQVWPSSSCLDGTNSSLSGGHHHSSDVGRESRQNGILLVHYVLSCAFTLTHSLEISIRKRAECTPLVQDSSFSFLVLISRECATLLSRRENRETLFCAFPMWIEVLSTHISRIKGIFSLALMWHLSLKGMKYPD